MKIQWLGHSSFKLEESTGTTIVTDPYNNIGFDMPKIHADAVTISHNHKDHSNINAVLGKPKIFNKAGVYDFKGVHITAIPSFHDEELGNQRGENLIFKYRMDGVEICHLGDIGHKITPEIIELLVPVNVLLIPIGGNYTISAETAKEYVDVLMPDIVIPMHYKVKNISIDVDKPDLFLKLFDDEKITVTEQNIVEIDRDDLDEVSTKVILLKKLDL